MKDNDGDADDDENDVHQHYNIVINYVIMTSQCAQCTSKIHNKENRYLDHRDTMSLQ